MNLRGTLDQMRLRPSPLVRNRRRIRIDLEWRHEQIPLTNREIVGIANIPMTPSTFAPCLGGNKPGSFSRKIDPCFRIQSELFAMILS